MARISLLRYRLFLSALRNVRSQKLLFLLNVAIFISIFALSASSLSIYFENKIDKIETKIIREDTQHIIYNNWLNKAPRQIKNNDKILMGLFKEENYKSLIRSLGNQDEMSPEDIMDYTLISDREEFYTPYFTLRKRVEFNFTAMIQSVTDAILVSSSEQELKKIIEYRKKYINLNKKFYKLENSRHKFETEHPRADDIAAKKRFIFYKKFREYKKEIESILIEQNSFFLNFCLTYFSEKRDDYLKNISFYQNEIKLLSKKESTLIFIAFIIQIIIFGIAQFFEFTLEYGRKKNRIK